MNIKSEIKVGNNVTRGFDTVAIETNCHGFVTLKIPVLEPKGAARIMELELDRKELREFLARTCPAFQQVEQYRAETGLENVRLPT